MYDVSLKMETDRNIDFASDRRRRHRNQKWVDSYKLKLTKKKNVFVLFLQIEKNVVRRLIIAGIIITTTTITIMAERNDKNEKF